MDLPERLGLVIWLYTPKYINKLKRYGLLHYVSRKMNYAILYINKNNVEDTKKNLLKLHFVREVELSKNTKISEDYDNVLKEVEKMSKKNKDMNKTDKISLFTELSEQGELKL